MEMLRIRRSQSISERFLISFLNPIRVLSDELAPIGLAVGLGLLGGMLGVVDVLAL